MTRQPHYLTRPSIEGLIGQLEAAAEGNAALDRAISEYLTGQADSYPAYTSSIDMALTLAPSGAVWHVMTDYGDLNRAQIGPSGRPSASIYKDADQPLFVTADAATPALAVCIAAIKARAALAPEPPR